ncbi:Ectonucleoside triphosphate diphosphohydrolase 7 [Amphibalanus amphitrite]|uniref:Ectonucleoside triphosphate diphosphohydrolase 7 n=1 Tax=Amphibalanus amphitrite TaxID=1232801 RepID=A0A6A4VRR1_AMPAM|nr:Ectonucleoside triphosphate diphosphohydrolase 7 [Amphibalanus amphitrite]
MMPRINVPCLSGMLSQRLQGLLKATAPIWTPVLITLTLLICTILLVTHTLATIHSYQGYWSESRSPLAAEGLGYAIVIDAGSSGSRAHIYVWPPHTGNRKDLLNIQPLRDHSGQPRVHMITPGLSSLRLTPERAGDYVRPLLDYAATHIPAEKHRETSLYIMATAGMRLLSKDTQTAIIENLHRAIGRRYQFLLAENNIQVISGREEGIYQWIAINFALGRFRHGHDGPTVTVETVSDQPIRRLETVGALDMGGASMQIGFEITSAEQLKALEGKVHRASMATINLGCADHDREHTYRVYVTTFLGYGANEAYRRHSEAVRARYTNTTRRLYDPCLVRDFTEPPPVVRNTTACAAAASTAATSSSQSAPATNSSAASGHSGPAGSNCTIPVVGTGDWGLCEQMVRRQIVEERITRLCEVAPPEGCTRTLVPPPVNLTNVEFYGFSEFWYSMEDTLRSGGQYSYSRFSQTAKDYCATSWPTLLRRRGEGLYGTSDDERLARQCFKSVYLTAALHTGLGLPRSYGGLTSTASVVRGRVSTWTLGALLFKLRFLPVRSVEAATFSSFPAGPYGIWGSQYLLLACVLVVLGVLLLYALRLRRLRRGRPRARLLSEHEPMLLGVSVS